MERRYKQQDAPVSAQLHAVPTPLEQTGAFDGAASPADSRPPVAAAIAARILELLPARLDARQTRAKATVSSNLLIVSLFGHLTDAEDLLLGAGHAELVPPTRELMLRGLRAEAIAIIEQLTHSKVVAFLTDNDPDLAVMCSS